MKPERQNPFWPAVPRPRRGVSRVMAVAAAVLVVLVAVRFLARIFWG